MVPGAFFTEVLPGIEDEAELRVTLFLFYMLGRHKGHPRYVSRHELEALAPLAESLAPLPGEIADNLTRGLDLAARRQAFLLIDVARDGRADTLFFLNTPADRRAFEKVRDGLLPVPGAAVDHSEPPAPVRDNIFQLYEANIGPITPLIAREQREAEQLWSVRVGSKKQ